MKTSPKTSYINNVPLAHGEVTIVTSDTAEEIMKHSCKLASEIKKAGVGTLLINCGMSGKRFREHFYDAYEESSKMPHLIVKNSMRGDLIGERDSIDQIVLEASIGVVIISGWEWTSSSYRRKQRLLFYLRELAEEQNIAVIVYCNTTTTPVAGRVDHGGVGRLAEIAVAVVEIATSEKLGKSVAKPRAIVVKNEEERQAMEESAQLLGSKINGLQGEKQGLGDRVQGIVPMYEQPMVVM